MARSSTGNPDDVYVYFLFSEEQKTFREGVERAMNRKFVPGSVMVNGARKRFTEMSLKNTGTYPDTKIVAEGLRSNMKFTLPTTTPIIR